MNRLTSVGRADLVALVGPDGSLDLRSVRVCGFGLGPFTQKSEPSEPTKAPTESEVAPVEEPPPGPAVSEVPSADRSVRPALTFFFAESMERVTAPPPIVQDKTVPFLPNHELKSNYDRPALPLKALARWSRLLGFLRRALGRETPCLRIDVRALDRLLASGSPLTRLPRITRWTWGPQAVVLRDFGWQEMAPFQADVDALLLRLKRERGEAGLSVIPLDGPPPLRFMSRIPTGVPVLTLATLDQYRKDPQRLRAWVAMGLRLAARRQPHVALVPCPRRLWHPAIARVWPMAVWDRAANLPRWVGRSVPLPASSAADDATARLMDLLAPATFVEAPLLRSTRLTLGCPADVGSEWLAWFDSLGWASSHSFGMLKPGSAESSAEQAARLARRKGQGDLARAVDSLIQQQHQRHSPLIAWEASLRAALSASDSAAALEEVRCMLHRIVVRLREMAGTPSRAEHRRSNLAPWFVEMVDRIPEAMRAARGLSALIGEGLGLAQSFLRTERIVWPTALDAAAAESALDAHSTPLPGTLTFRLSYLPNPTGLESKDKKVVLVPEASGAEFGEMPLARFRASHRPLHVAAVAASGVPRSFTQFLSTFEQPLLEQPSDLLAPLNLRSDLERLHLKCLRRPAWARRMWHDVYGLAAEFRIREVPFVLRWIPPGTFQMGSPNDEPGRVDSEGPQHEVQISRGFWMGNTPVTQGQWRAVVEAAGAQQGLLKRLLGKKPLNPAPSHFQGPAELPVESVSWEDCERFCAVMRALLPNGPGFQLPTEAQWEYACRAGAKGAPFVGPMRLDGDVCSPDLDPFAWYGGNSGKEIEVRNPKDSTLWLGTQHGSKSAGTHRVKLKQANAAGLYGVLGNVGEWCRDGWDEAAYAKRQAGIADPFVTATDRANRVVRGGSWKAQARHCRAAYRSWLGPGSRFRDRGLRLSAGQELQGQGGGAAVLGAERPAGEAEVGPEGRRQPVRVANAQRQVPGVRA